MRVLVTGATGFVGRSLVPLMVRKGGMDVIGSSRRPGQQAAVAGATFVESPELSASADWQPLLSGIDAIVHAAARVHVLREEAGDALSEFRRANVEGTLALAEQAARSGVRRFVFVSSIHVNGAETNGSTLTEASAAAPHSPYAISKYEAEQRLTELAASTPMELVVVRPTLVYGPGALGNLASLTSMIRRGLPLPFAAVDNRRSLISVDNLAELLFLCLVHPKAAGELFLAADGVDLSTPDIIRYIGRDIGRTARLYPFPETVLRMALSAAGKNHMSKQLFGSLQVDVAKAKSTIGWSPALTPQTARWA